MRKVNQKYRKVNQKSTIYYPLYIYKDIYITILKQTRVRVVDWLTVYPHPRTYTRTYKAESTTFSQPEVLILRTSIV